MQGLGLGVGLAYTPWTHRPEGRSQASASSEPALSGAQVTLRPTGVGIRRSWLKPVKGHGCGFRLVGS